MDKLDLVLREVQHLREDQRDRFARLEGKFDKHVEATDGRFRTLETRVNIWRGGLAALATIAGTVGSAVTLAAAAARAKWGG